MIDVIEEACQARGFEVEFIKASRRPLHKLSPPFSLWYLNGVSGRT
jgi:hypothetical protein